MSKLGETMFRGQIQRSSAALALAGIVTAGLAIGAASAQTPPLALQKFPTGPISPIAIATGSDGNLYISGNGVTATGTTGAAATIEVMSPLGIANPLTVPFAGAQVGDLTSGPDGNIWYVDTGTKAIGQLEINERVFVETSFSNLTPASITAAPDNTTYFTETTGTMIGRIATDGSSQIFTQGIASGAGIQKITGGPNGNVWFTEAGVNRIGEITPAGRIFEFGSGISPGAGLFDIKTGVDGNLWFTESKTGFIGRITPAGVVTEFHVGLNPKNGPFVLTPAPDGSMWFAETSANQQNGAHGSNRIGRITLAGQVSEFVADLPNLGFPASVAAITRGPSNTVWFVQTEADLAGELTLKPASVLAAAILPGGRTVGPGAAATVFATMINSGTAALSNCQVTLPGNAPLGLGLSFAPTDPATNAVTGMQNIPFGLDAGQSQSLLLTFQSAGPIFAPGLQLVFSCGQTVAAPAEGVNTVDVNFSADAVPDDIALAAAATPGLLSIPVNGIGAFSVAMTNAGATSTDSPLTQVAVDTGLSIFPMTATFCRTDASGNCLSAPLPTAFFSLPAGSTATFTVFVTAQGHVPFDPNNSRVFLRFFDFDQQQITLVSRGSTSVAVQTTN